jgi:hypothetical protein
MARLAPNAARFDHVQRGQVGDGWETHSWVPGSWRKNPVPTEWVRNDKRRARTLSRAAAGIW